MAFTRSEVSAAKWARRRDIPFAILAWTVLVGLVLWGAGHIIRTLLLLTIAGLLAYALAPGVKILHRFMPRFLAIVIMYLLVLGVLGFLTYLIVITAISQVSSLAIFIQTSLTPKGAGQLSPLEQTLRSIGISQAQISSFSAQLTTRLEGAANDALPVVSGVINAILDIVLVAVLSIYLLSDGIRISTWVRENAPSVVRAGTVLNTLQRIVGGYIRGQLIMSTLIGVLVGVGMFVFQVPYAVFLGVMAFVLAFIPVLGTLASGAICVLLALTNGWVIALGVLIYFIVVHIIEGDVIGPRIVGQAVGLHPVISIAALIAGSELFGIWGALLASPIVGVLQVLVTALWTNWRQTRPEQFQQETQQVVDTIDKKLPTPEPPPVPAGVAVVSQNTHPSAENDSGEVGVGQH